MAEGKKSRVRTIVGFVAAFATVAAVGSIVWQMMPERPVVPTFKPTPPTPLKPRTAEDIANDDTQDAELMAALAVHQRWAPLPSFVRGVERDASGRIWFDPPLLLFPSVGYTSDDLHRSVERAAHGLTRIIRGGRILIVDSKGRYWCRAEKQTHLLLCYDGTRWLEPRTAPETTPRAAATPIARPQPQPQAPPQPGTWCDNAFEDSKGNLYFASAALMRHFNGFHVLGRDGSWTFHATPEIVSGDSNTFPQHPLFLEQSGGRIAMYARFDEQENAYRGADSNTVRKLTKQQIETGYDRENLLRVLIYDADGWRIYEPKDRKQDSAWVAQVLPLPDGSIATFYNGADLFAVQWPSPSNEQIAAQVDALIPKLDDADAAVRQAATERLLKLGPPVREKIESLVKSPDSSPEKSIALQQILDNLAQMATGEKRANDVLLAGRYTLNGVHYVSRTYDGKVRLFARACTDHVTGAPTSPAFVTISRDGTWSATPIPTNMEHADWVRNWSKSAYEDITGTLWLGDVVLEPDMKLHAESPPGMQVGWVAGSDRDGHVYFSSPSGMLVYNREIPEGVPDLPQRLVESWRLYHLPGESIAWGLDSKGPFQITSAGNIRRTNSPQGLEFAMIYPLRNGAAVGLSRGGLLQACPSFWDGRQWSMSQSMFLHDLVHEHAKELVAAAPKTSGSFVGDLFRRPWLLAADHDRGIWLQCESYERPEQPSGMWYDRWTRYLEYFDGKEWHDAWALFADPEVDKEDAEEEASRDPKARHPDVRRPHAADQYEVLGVIDGGHILLLLQKGDSRSVEERSLIGVWFDGNAMKQRTLVDARVLGPGNINGIVRHDGGLWIVVQAGDKRVYYDLHQGKSATGAASDAEFTFVKQDFTGELVWLDDSDRLWLRDGKMLTVIAGDKRASLNVPSLTQAAQLTVSPDGRIWLLHRDGISWLGLSDEGQKLALQEKGMWRWNAIRNEFEAFCDGAGGMWIGGKTMALQIARLTLPEAPSTTQP